MGELVDPADSKSAAARHLGSTPSSPTKFENVKYRAAYRGTRLPCTETSKGSTPLRSTNYNAPIVYWLGQLVFIQ